MSPQAVQSKGKGRPEKQAMPEQQLNYPLLHLSERGALPAMTHRTIYKVSVCHDPAFAFGADGGSEREILPAAALCLDHIQSQQPGPGETES